MWNRRFLVLALVITAFAALVIGTSIGGGSSGTHAMPGGQTMQDEAMED